MPMRAGWRNTNTQRHAVQDQQQLQFWKFKEVEELNREKVSSNGGLEFEVNGDEITLTERDAKRKTISIYNTVEKLNKHPSVFINYLRVLARGKGYGFEIDEEIEEGSGEKGEKANSKIVNTMEAKEIEEDEYEDLRRKRKAGKTTSEENFAIEKHYWQKFFVSQELDEKLLKHYMYDNVFNNFLGLVDLENHRKVDTLESQRFVERVGLVRELLTGLGFTSPLDHLAVERETFLVNFMMNIVEGRSFANNFKTNELFGLSKGNRIDSEMSEDRVRNWVNRILKQFSLRVVAQGNGFGLEQLGEILEIIKRKNRIGKNFEDSANLLKQKRRPKQDLDTSKLDPFIDDEPEPKPVVVKQQAAVKPLPPKRGKDVPVWIPESDDEEPVKPKPKPKPKPVVEDLFMDDEPKPVAKPKQAGCVLGPVPPRPNVVIAPIIEEEAPEIDYTPQVLDRQQVLHMMRQRTQYSKFIPDSVPVPQPQQPVVKQKKVRSSKFIPDLDW
jgi:hypothetical protein